MGAASDGGYLGKDVLAFLSSLLSGAAGAYRITIGRATKTFGHTVWLVCVRARVCMIRGEAKLITTP